MTLPGPSPSNDLECRIAAVLITVILGFCLWSGWTVQLFLPSLAGLMAGIVLGRLLEPLIGSRFRAGGRPNLTQLSVPAANLGNLLLNRLHAEPVSALLLSALIVLVLGQTPWDGLKRVARTLKRRVLADAPSPVTR